MLKKIWVPQKFSNILIGLLSADLLFIILQILHRLDFVTNILPVLDEHAFSLSAQRGLAESFMYVKEFWIALLFFWMVIRWGKKAYLTWAFLFGYFLFDDMLNIHESIGSLLALTYGYEPEMKVFLNLRAQDYGEMAVSGLVALLLFSFMISSYLKGNDEVKKVFRSMFQLLIALVVFGVGIDVIGSAFDSYIVGSIFRFVEDSGEMVVISATLWYVFTLFDKTKDSAARKPLVSS
jgi:hypothetical protein